MTGKPMRPIPDPAVFKSGFGKWAMMLDDHTEADPVGVLVSLMAFFATYIGRTPRIKSKGRQMVLSFWPTMIGYASIGHKGTATDLAWDVARIGIPSFAAENVMRIPDSGLGLLLELEKRKNIATGQQAPTLVIEPEMGTKLIPVLQRDGRYSAALTTLWDGVSLLYSSGTNQVEIPDPHVSIIGHVQPDLLESSKKGTAAKAGVWTRFFGVWVTQSKELDWFDDDPDLEKAIYAAGKLFGRAAMDARETRILEVPSETRAAVRAHHRPAVMALLNSAREVRTYCERLPAYMLRIAALNALSDRRDWISVQDFDAALALCKYSVESMIHMLRQEGAGENRTTLAMKIVRHITQYGPTIYTDLKAACSGTNNKPAFIAAFIELKKSISVYTLPREVGQMGPLPWIIGPELPENGTLVDLEAELNKRRGHHQAPPEPPPQEEDEIIVEVTVVKEEPEGPAQPMRMLTAPPVREEPPRASQATTEAQDIARASALLEKGTLSPDEEAELVELAARIQAATHRRNARTSQTRTRSQNGGAARKQRARS